MREFMTQYVISISYSLPFLVYRTSFGVSIRFLHEAPLAGCRQADAPTDRTVVVSRGVSLPAPWGRVVWLHAKFDTVGEVFKRQEQ